MKTYNTYLFTNKDPVIDIVRTCVEIFAARNNLKTSKAMSIISKSSGVSVSCMNNWFYGSVRRPYFATVMAVVHATGREMKIEGHAIGSKVRFKPTRHPHLKVVA